MQEDEVPHADHSSVHLANLLLARGPTPSRQVANEEQCRVVRQALDRLPDCDREILLMRTFDNLPYNHIAYILPIDAGLARVRHGRALMRQGRVLREPAALEHLRDKVAPTHEGGTGS